MDLSRLRDQTLDSGQDEEAVTVNTRALVDKILARYSGEYTTIRELIQNAADAKATKVTIKLETSPSKVVPVPQTTDQSALLRHTLQHHTMRQMVITNNGDAFQDADWARLKRIAEGNPDETKIGAFGVGFYSVFADCEDPFVVSGQRTMAFYWKNNSLFTKSGKLPADQPNSDTQFLLNYRNEEAVVPDLMSLSTFLTTSLTFVDLEAIELKLEDWTIMTLKKIRAPGMPVPIPSDISTKTQEGMMKIVSLVHQSTQIEAVWMNIIARKQGQQWQTVQARPDKSSQAVGGLSGFFSKFAKAANNMTATNTLKEKDATVRKAIEEDLTGTSRATAFLRTSTVNVQTHVNLQLARDLERATKKPPPKKTRIEILTMSHDEASAFSCTIAGASSHKATDLFASVLTSKSGRIFIGFPTKQTTGILCHISAPSVIPTVEREAIDLNAESVRNWNNEMLRVAGIACRIAFASDMTDLKKELARKMAASGSKFPSKADLDAIMPTATHIFQQFTPQDTTPESRVGKIIQDAFWNSGSASMEMLSTRGVLPCKDVRLLKQKLTFLDSVPSVPEELTRDASEFVYKLYSMGYLTELTVRDMQKELESRALDERQLQEFLKWAGTGLQSDELDAEVVHRLFGSAVINLASESDTPAAGQPGQSSHTRLLTLNQIKTFHGHGRIPAHLPVPPSTIPYRLVKSIPRAQLESFGWTDLQVLPWLRFILANATPTSKPEESGVPNLRFDETFAGQVLLLLSKQWDTISSSSKGSVVDLISDIPVVPTKRGLKKPSEAYFTSVKIFDDLPTMIGLQGVKEKFLAALGVRKTIELNVVFDRLLPKNSSTEQAKWSFADLIRYFVTVRDDIPKSDLERLRTAPICPMDQPSGTEKDKMSFFPVTDMYQPDPQLRILRLPQLKWEGQWRDNSQEARFLRSIGLKPYPAAVELVQMMQGAGQAKDYPFYTNIINYFLNAYMTNGYARAGTANMRMIPFLQLEGVAFPLMGVPNSCYSNPRAASLGFPLVSTSIRPISDKFGVLLDPDLAECAEKIIARPPKSKKEAVDMFGYLASRLQQIDDSLIDRFSNASIVPISPKNDTKGLASRWMTPRSCFLGDSATYGDIFDFVNFGEEANMFLLKVGSKHEPNSLELAEMIVDTPAKMLGSLGEKRYLEVLRKLAEHVSLLKANKELFKKMKTRPFLLAYRDFIAKRGNNEKSLLDDSDFEDEEDMYEREMALRSAGEIVHVDSVREYARFREHLMVPPEDESLEIFYNFLGVPPLSSLVDVDERIGNQLRDQSNSQNYRKLVLERIRLFLYDYTKDLVYHDARWIEKNLSLVDVDSISVRVALKGYKLSYSEKRTAAVSKTARNAYNLYITPKPDMYELSSQLSMLLLKKPKKTDVMALETVLLSDLRGLRGRGYNVNRILKQKETEARLAEESRKKQQEEERRLGIEAKAAADRNEKQRVLQAHADGQAPPPPYDNYEHPSTPAGSMAGSSSRSKTTTPLPQMPGAFGSPENDSPDSLVKETQPRKSNSFLSRLGDKLGNQLGYHPPVPQGFTKPDNIQRNLTNAIQACRSHESSSVFSPPTKTMVEQAQSGLYCDEATGQNIEFFANTSSGVKVYLAKHIAESASDANGFAASDLQGVERFAAVLCDLVGVFDLSPTGIHIYHDDRSKAIAFNLDGALFCNYHYFKELHLYRLDGQGAGKIDALSYWWITVCHELAHNLEKGHGAQHSFYTESFASAYFGKMMAKAMQYS